MPHPATFEFGIDRVRVEYRPNPPHGVVAVITPMDRSTVPAGPIRRCLERLPPGVTSARSAVLTEPDAAPFLEAGFATVLRLEVLTHDLRDIPSARAVARGLRGGLRIRTLRSADIDAALEVDRAAFGAIAGIPDSNVARGWTDESAMHDAMRATPAARARVAVRGDAVVGFAICGRADRAGYLQRLAVSPDAQGGGIGSALVLDALRWSRRHRVGRVAVNTQVGNDRALRRYRALGFVSCAPHLVICERPVGGPVPPGAP